jgi:oxygen-independent coproporphyrinogen-3 oxidase
MINLRRYFNIDDDCEITCEGTPQNFDVACLDLLKACGFNRLSAGVQTFDHKIRTEHMNMPDGKDEIVRCIERMEHYFPNFNLDFIYNLPGQTAEIWADDLATAVGSGAKHLTIYPLVPLTKTKFYTDLVERAKYPPPEQNQEIAFFNYTMEVLRSSAFTEKYSVNDWAVPGHESRYVVRDAESHHVIALGCVAHGYVGGMVYKNIRDPRAYIKAMMERSELPIDAQHVLTEQEEMERYMVMGLRLKRRSMSTFENWFDHRAQDVFASEIADMCASDFIKMAGDAVVFTPKGDVWQNNVRTYFESAPLPCVGYSDTIGLGTVSIARGRAGHDRQCR